MARRAFPNRWNRGAIEEHYRSWQSDPDSVDERWQIFFEGFELATNAPPPGAPLQGVRIPGGAWFGKRDFYAADNRRSYPTLIEVRPGRWLAFRDSSNSPDKRRTAIRFGRLRIGK